MAVDIRKHPGLVQHHFRPSVRWQNLTQANRVFLNPPCQAGCTFETNRRKTRAGLCVGTEVRNVCVSECVCVCVCVCVLH